MSDNGAPLVEFQDLAVSYGLVQALSGVSGVFQPGPTGLLGPNGAGKTTLLKTLLGFLPPGPREVDGLWPRPDQGAARSAPPARLHAGAGLSRAGHDRLGLRGVRGRALRPAARRGHQPRPRGALLRRPRRGPLPQRRDLLDRHEAAGQARAGARARPGPAPPRRAHERARPAGPRGDAGPHPRHRHAAGDEPHPLLAPAARRGARLHERDRLQPGPGGAARARSASSPAPASRSSTCASRATTRPC